MGRYSYEADWRPYAFPPQKTGFAAEEDLKQRYSCVPLMRGRRLAAGGMPILFEGDQATVNTESEHTIIFGGTASKKTRTCILPLACILAQAGESMVLLDCKGEISNGRDFPQLRGLLDEKGYHSIFFNLRSLDGDALNPMLEPYRFYKAGKKDEAKQMVSDFVEALADIYHGTSVDPFWESTAKQYLISVIMLMFSFCEDEKQVNLHSLAAYLDEDGCGYMRRVADMLSGDSNILTMLRAVTSEADRTRMSTLATANSMLTGFISNEKLLRMLSVSTFDIHDFYKQPTALFIILPDETDTFSRAAGMILKQISTILVQDAYKLRGKLPRRVNFLCDEFCNYHIHGMDYAIAAHRSRNIRWYLVCQSLKQLKACYPKEADTILANCTNLYFLSSPEMELLEYLSKRAGMITLSPDGAPVPLLSVEDLQSLKKGWEYTQVYFTSGNTHYVTELPDISLYSFAEHGPMPELPVNEYANPPLFSPKDMFQCVEQGQHYQNTDLHSMEAVDLDHLFDDCFAVNGGDTV